jgi:hypothetical protein
MIWLAERQRVSGTGVHRVLTSFQSAQGLSEYAVVVSLAWLAAVGSLSIFGWSTAQALADALGQVVLSLVVH